VRAELLLAVSAGSAHGAAHRHVDLPRRSALHRSAREIMIEELFRTIAAYVALAVETAAVLIVAFGAAEAVLRTLAHSLSKQTDPHWLKPIWIRFGTWLLLSLQFALAADIVRSAISPDWEQIGHLAAIAVIRTFLSYFLERDLREPTRGDSRSRADAAA
jgi:uncharacterized membrane protein